MSDDSMKQADEINQLREQVEAAEREKLAKRAATSAAISDTVDQVATTAEDAAQAVNAKYESAADAIRAHPFAYVIGAAFVGLILGKALR